MSKIPYTSRRNGKYYFRRRARWQNVGDYVAIIPLNTCNAQEARTRSITMASRFEELKGEVSAMMTAGRTIDQELIQQLFDNELRHALDKLLTDYHGTKRPDYLVNYHKTMAAAYDAAQRPGARNELSENDRSRLGRSGLTPDEIEWVAADLDRHVPSGPGHDAGLALYAEGLGLEPTDAIIGKLRSISFRASSEAHRLAAQYLDDDVQSTIDPEATLWLKRRQPHEELTFLTIAKAAAPAASPAAVLSADIAESLAAPQGNRHFDKYDARPFSSVIDEAVGTLAHRKRWRGDTAERAQIARVFAWITGDKALGDYSQDDVTHFLDTLLRIPVGFRFKEHWDGSLKEILGKPDLLEGKQRSERTVNKYMTVLAAIASILEEGPWQANLPNTQVISFQKGRYKDPDGNDDNEREPWTDETLKVLFSAPVWTGNDGHLRRLTPGRQPRVYHDAAYWVPLLLYYTHAALNEICGLEFDDVVLSSHHEDGSENGGLVPRLGVRNNQTRGTEKEKRGLKNAHRKRWIPIHPELLRLGFAEYVSAIRSEGSTALFPELWTQNKKKGGSQFRDRAWVHMISWLAKRASIPTNDAGKKADLHSFRTTGSSNYTKATLNDNVRAKIMGHAPVGTNAKHYEKREKRIGLNALMREHLDVMITHTPINTAALIKRPIYLLPLIHRSRVGSAKTD